MSFKKTFIGLIILGILIGFYLLDSSRKVKKGQEEDSINNLSSIRSADIIEIDLIKKGDDIDFIKDEDTSSWMIKSYNEGLIPADSGNVSILIEKIGNIRRSESFGNVSDLEKYGLAKPAVILKVKSDETESVIKLGKKTPADDGVYLLKDNDKNLYVAESDILSAVDKTLYDFRDKKFANLEPEKIAGFDFSVADKTFKLEKTGDKWMLDAGKEYRADDEVVRRVLNSLSAAQVKEFLKPETDDKDTRGLNNPEVRITLKDDEGKEINLSFGKDKQSSVPVSKKKTKKQSAAPSVPENIYARNSAMKADMLVEKSLTADLKTDIQFWRSKKIVDVPFDAISDTKIEGPEKTVAFRKNEKDPSEFVIYEPETMSASHWECNSLNNRIANISAVEFLDPTPENMKKAAFGKPYATITFKTDKSKINPDVEAGKTYMIIIGAEDKKDKTSGRYVKVSGDDKEVFLVSDDVLKDVIKTSFDLRDKDLIHVKADEVEKITIKTVVGKKKTDIVIEEDGTKWEVSDPRELRDKNVDDILWDIISLRMDGTAAKHESLSDYGLETPFAVITLHLNNGKKTVIKLGCLIPGDNPSQNYLMIDGDKNVYITSIALRNVISGLVKK